MKETKIEKLILDLSTRWDCSPQETVDRLNSMNESEINKLINSMTNKFKNGGFIDCLRNGGSVSKCKCGCDKIAKVQDGRVLGSEQYKHATRKDAIDAAMNQMGFSKQQARLAYRNQKNALRNAGFRGNEMRQHARYNIIDTAYPRAVEEPINTVERVAPLQRMTTVTGGLSSSDPGIIRKTIAPDAEWTNGQATFRNMSFGEAFNRARQMGVSNFGWDDPSAKYGSYGTGFKPAEEKSAQQQEMEYNDRAVENVRKKGGFWNTILSGIMSNTNYPMK